MSETLKKAQRALACAGIAPNVAFSLSPDLLGEIASKVGEDSFLVEGAHNEIKFAINRYFLDNKASHKEEE